MSKVALLKESLAHVTEIVSSVEFSSQYGENEQRFFAAYKKELEDELAEEEGREDDTTGREDDTT